MTSGCSAPFGSLTQQFAFYEMSSQIVRLHDENASPGASSGTGGALAIFDTNGGSTRAEYVVRGETAEASMYALLKKATQDPCTTDGPQPRIAAFAPPATVNLPISFVRCSTLRNRVEIVAAQARALRGVLAANARNRKDLDRIAVDIAKISAVQEKSWAQAIEKLTDMARDVKSGAAK